MNRDTALTILLGLGLPVIEANRAAAVAAVLDELTGNPGPADRFRRGLVAALGRNPNEPGSVPSDAELIGEVAEELEIARARRDDLNEQADLVAAATALARWYDGPHPGLDADALRDAQLALDRFRKACGYPRYESPDAPDAG